MTASPAVNITPALWKNAAVSLVGMTARGGITVLDQATAMTESVCGRRSAREISEPHRNRAEPAAPPPRHRRTMSDRASKQEGSGEGLRPILEHRIVYVAEGRARPDADAVRAWGRWQPSPPPRELHARTGRHDKVSCKGQASHGLSSTPLHRGYCQAWGFSSVFVGGRLFSAHLILPSCAQIYAHRLVVFSSFSYPQFPASVTRLLQITGRSW